MTPALLLATSLLTAPPAHAGGEIEVGVPEPSGIDIDRRGGRVFVVDDGGEVWVLDEDFRTLSVFDIGGDLEGVAYMPRQDRLLVAVEGAEQLLLLDPDSGRVKATFDIPRTFRGETLLASGGNGIETLTVVGQRIFVANQSFDSRDAEDGSVLVELSLTAGQLSIVDAHPLPMLDVAGSFYSAQTGELFLASDSENTVYNIDLSTLDAAQVGAPLPAEAFDSVSVPGRDQEGICVIDGHLVIAQDSGNLYDAGPMRDL